MHVIESLQSAVNDRANRSYGIASFEATVMERMQQVEKTISNVFICRFGRFGNISRAIVLETSLGAGHGQPDSGSLTGKACPCIPSNRCGLTSASVTLIGYASSMVYHISNAQLPPREHGMPEG